MFSQGIYQKNDYSRTVEILLDHTEYNILYDSEDSKNFTSRNLYVINRYLHCLTKFTSKCKSIQVGNQAFVLIMFVLPVVIDVYGQRFEINTMVSEIYNNVDTVPGIKNFMELEVDLDKRS